MRCKRQRLPLAAAGTLKTLLLVAREGVWAASFFREDPYSSSTELSIFLLVVACVIVPSLPHVFPNSNGCQLQPMATGHDLQVSEPWPASDPVFTTFSTRVLLTVLPLADV